MTVFLDGVGAEFYRGIGSETQLIAPFGRMNFFIGANNSGKSIVLNLIAKHLKEALSTTRNNPINGPEVHRGSVTGEFKLLVGRSVEALVEKVTQNIDQREFDQLARQFFVQGTLEDTVHSVYSAIAVGSTVWVPVPVKQEKSIFFPPVDTRVAGGWTDKWYPLWGALTQNRQYSNNPERWVRDALPVLASRVAPSLPDIHMIPAKRVLGDKASTFDDLSGKGLIGHLATLQNPSYDKQGDRKKFERINRFLQEVVGKSEAVLEVPSDREHLLVHMDNKVLPLSSFGTGIHEVVLIAAFSTIHDNSILCIEEPEVHLHPLLQRKLVNYLLKNTSSQYFIATHSSVFIDTLGAHVFHVANDGEQTRVKPVITREGQRGILNDLGAQASDILQSNAIIWVEGPSDRIYVNHWINAIDTRLQEGVHYSIMFYGGGLIRHLTTSDSALGEFIRLKDLNRNMAVILDSDRDSAEARLKPHVQRIVDEMAKSDDTIAWVTSGREIENYINGNKLQAALKKLHPKLYLEPGKTTQFDHAFYFFREDPEKAGRRKTYKDGNKVGAASIICDEAPDLDVLDLRERLQELTAMIQKANGLEA